MSIDPVTTDANTGGSFNRYAYANNSPYSYIDPDGRDSEPVPMPVVIIPAPLPIILPTTTITPSRQDPFASPVLPSRSSETISGKSYVLTMVQTTCAVAPYICLPFKWAKPPRDAKAPNGAKAPGKPGAGEGFRDPKKGENWVRNPNGHGSGWEAADGQVWVPTGPDSGSTGDAHGGEHWDVQDPKTGDHTNIYPGGNSR